jgi:hypothetical protein
VRFRGITPFQHLHPFTLLEILVLIRP